ncbi:MAG: hypothetical protein Kow00121_37370 [Elainellaceae cyanobacterium]
MQSPVPICTPDAKATQAGSYTDAHSNCVSAPETIAVALETTSRSRVRQIEDAAQSPASTNPQPAAPEQSSAIDWSTEKPNVANAPWLRLGAQGQAVLRLQTQLQQLGYNSGAIDGSYGSLTQAAVIEFQQANGLGVDGVVGTETWAKLQQAIAQQNQQATSSTPTPKAQPSTPEPQPSAKAQPEPEATDPPSPSAKANSASSVDTTQNSDPTPSETGSAAGNYLWILGWLVIYGGGWVLILKDVTKELRGFPVVVAPQRRKRVSVAKPVTKPVANQSAEGQSVVKPPAVKPPIANQPVAEPSDVSQSIAPQQADAPAPVAVAAHAPNYQAPVSSSISYEATEPQPDASPDRLPIVNALADDPFLEEEARFIWANQPLDIIPADQGVTIPLNNLFVELNHSGAGRTTRHPRSRPGSRSINRPVTSPATSVKPTPSAQSTPSAKPATSIEPAINSAKATNGTELTVQPPDDHETLVAALPTVSEQGDPCTYLLLEDASGLFILRGNELRVINQRLSGQNSAASHVIKVRRTDAKGVSLEKSFKLDIKKTSLTPGATTAPVPA